MTDKLVATLSVNPTARANLIDAIESLNLPEMHANHRCDRLAYLATTLREIGQGFSGGNDTLREKGLHWDEYCFRR